MTLEEPGNFSKILGSFRTHFCVGFWKVYSTTYKPMALSEIIFGEI